MKYIKLIIGSNAVLLLLAFLTSCDPEFSSKTVIQNDTSNNLTISFIPNSEEFIFYIEKGMNETVYSDSDIGGGKLAIDLSDTIVVISGSGAKRVFEPSKRTNEEDNIYNIDSEYWTHKSSKHTSTATFSITDEMFN